MHLVPRSSRASEPAIGPPGITDANQVARQLQERWVQGAERKGKRGCFGFRIFQQCAGCSPRSKRPSRGDPTPRPPSAKVSPGREMARNACSGVTDSFNHLAVGGLTEQLPRSTCASCWRRKSATDCRGRTGHFAATSSSGRSTSTRSAKYLAGTAGYFAGFADDFFLIAFAGTDLINVLCAQGASLREMRAICKLLQALFASSSFAWPDLEVLVAVGWNGADYLSDDVDDRIVCVRDTDDRKPMRDRRQIRRRRHQPAQITRYAWQRPYVAAVPNLCFSGTRTTS